ncbi:MAG: aminoglycoside phosphotransferase family protein [Bacteroidetes bacterium]|nr:aminoglycoside phosphotransferase family protein [Bacteroidota bacterium]MDA1120348.1 aminoglycoside phosphotransferase family protein [Bacteroidota bacterium]
MGINTVIDLNKVADQFKIAGNVGTIEPFGNGHINDTYKVILSDSSLPGFLLQKINHHVFRDIDGLMNNIEKVTTHISQKSSDKNHALQLIASKNGKPYVKYEEEYWRIYRFMDGLQSHETTNNLQIVYEAGNAFGIFLRDLSGLPADHLTETIKNFHSIEFRITQLKEASGNRLKKYDTPDINSFIKKVLVLADKLRTIQKLASAGELPYRITHNDTKLNNVLFNNQGEAKCVVDLDTVMPGLVHFDFGDGVRTSASSAIEDEEDISKVDIDFEKFEAYSNGYLDATREALMPKEVFYLSESGALLSLIMAIRFLTDHLIGDRYYKINYQGHNLVRAKCQFRLAQIIFMRKSDMDRVINKFYKQS